MAADADAPLRVQSLLPLAAAAGVLKKVNRLVGVDEAEQHIRDELLEAWILLHLPPRPIAEVASLEQGRQVFSDLRRKPLKMPELVKSLGRDH
jgi:hypothetical protein